MAWERFGYTGSRPTPRVSRCTRTSPSAAMRGATPACGRRGPMRVHAAGRADGNAAQLSVVPRRARFRAKRWLDGPKLRLLVRSRQH